MDGYESAIFQTFVLEIINEQLISWRFIATREVKKNASEVANENPDNECFALVDRPRISAIEV